MPLALLWPLLEQGITLLASDLLTTPFGAFCYGVLNRLLIPLGLHQVLGSLMGLGESNLQALSAAQPLHEGYVAGLYPVIMFGLPGACFAIWLHRQRMRRLPQGACCSPWHSPRPWWGSPNPSNSCSPSPPPGCSWPMPC